MSRYIKERMMEEYAERFRDVAGVAVVNTEGIDANRLVTLRAALRGRGIQAMRVQNRICRRAFQDSPLAGANVLFDGPTTLVWGGESLVDVAKALVGEAKETKALEIRGGFSDGTVLSTDQIEALSELPSREELIGQVVGMAIGQAGRVVSLATAPAGSLLSQIRELAEGAESAEAEAPADETTEAPADEKAEAKPEAEAAETSAEAPADEAGEAQAQAAPDAAAEEKAEAPDAEADAPTEDAAEAKPAEAADEDAGEQADEKPADEDADASGDAKADADGGEESDDT